MQTITTALAKLQHASFRASFHLSEKDKSYIREKGMDVIRSHAWQLIRSRLAPAVIANDGRQTPLGGHPVFVAQHACACCCRGCLYKWYHVPMGQDLTETQQEKIVNLLMAWIEQEIANDQPVTPPHK